MAQWISLSWTGRALRGKQDYKEAETTLLSALSVATNTWGDSLLSAITRRHLAALAHSLRKLEFSELTYRQAQSTIERLAPDSIATGALLNDLAMFSEARTEFEETERLYRKALSILDPLSPMGIERTRTLGGLAGTARRRGQFIVARTLEEQAIEIQEARLPNSLPLAASYNNLGAIEGDTGNLSKAEFYFKKSLSIKNILQPNSILVANTLGNLAYLASLHGDHEMAEHYDMQAWSIQKRINPDSLDEAISLTNLGAGALVKGLVETALVYHSKAFNIREMKAPNSLLAAESLNNLGLTELERGNLNTARTYLQNSLTIKRRVVPKSLPIVNTLRSLARIDYLQRHFQDAERRLKEVLSIEESLAPGTASQADSQFQIALLYRETDRSQLARYHFSQSIEALDEQAKYLAGSHRAKAGFRQQYSDLYHQYLVMLLELNEVEKAYEILERARARTLLALLAERSLRFPSEIPEQLENERIRLSVRNDQLLSRLEVLNLEDDHEQMNLLRRQLTEVQNERASLLERVRSLAPRVAAMRTPVLPRFGDLVRTLDPGTVMLSYALGKPDSYLFILTSEGSPTVVKIPVGIAELAERIDLFRKALTKPSPRRERAGNTRSQAAELYNILIKPAEEKIKQGQRLLIIPDGPLYKLPFGALGKDLTHSTGKWSYLTELVPLHLAPSVAVYGNIRKRQGERKLPSDALLIAFGDPSNRSHTTAESQIMGRRKFNRSPLPGARFEVQRIAQLFKHSVVNIGTEATEERAQDVEEGTDYLHFACHGFVDDRLPLNSFLVLSPQASGQRNEAMPNGLLEAWEILENPNLGADLVVLSACDTALGEQIRGEGIIGLTWAFLSSGSRSVVSSQWRINDLSTAYLMQRFYERLAEGLPVDEALRAAQIELIHEPVLIDDGAGGKIRKDLSSPYYWSGFQLTGYWR